jgi:hypothetical protein
VRKQLFVIGILLQAIFVLAVTNDAQACSKTKYGNHAWCPKGSCAPDGGTWACDVNNHSPQHCKR